VHASTKQGPPRCHDKRVQEERRKQEAVNIRIEDDRRGEEEEKGGEECC